MDTWAIFTGTDVFLAIVGLIGFASVAIVLSTASGNVTKREINLRKNVPVQSDASDS